MISSSFFYLFIVFFYLFHLILDSKRCSFKAVILDSNFGLASVRKLDLNRNRE